MASRARHIICIVLVLVVVNIGYAFVQPTVDPARIVGPNVVLQARPNGPLLYVAGTLAAGAGSSLKVNNQSAAFPTELLEEVTVYEVLAVWKCTNPPACNVCTPTSNCVNPVPPPPPLVLSGSSFRGFLVPPTK